MLCRLIVNDLSIHEGVHTDVANQAVLDVVYSTQSEGAVTTMKTCNNILYCHGLYAQAKLTVCGEEQPPTRTYLRCS